MTPLKTKISYYIENFRRGKSLRRFERCMRQIKIQNQKVQIAKDLLLGHHLFEYKLQQDEIEFLGITSVQGKGCSMEKLVKTHKKYLG